MKKIVTLCAILSAVITTYGQLANLYTIPNQSAQFIRMPSRNATTDIDAVFFNPAGLTKMGNGFFFSINNQVLNQVTKVESTYSLFTENPKDYDGRVTGFVFPSVFFNYNINRASFHGGFMLIGGAGGVTYDNLPVSDRGIADVPAALIYAPIPTGTPGQSENLLELDNRILNETGMNPGYSNITDYRFDFTNKGLGYSPAFQGGFSYRANDIFSASFDVRYVSQRIQSKGYVKDIEVLVESNVDELNGWQTPGDYLRELSDETGNTFYNFTAGVYEDLSADRFIDVKLNGNGFIPIIGVNITPIEKLNIAVKYEPKTKIALKTTVNNGQDGGEQNGVAVFKQDSVIFSDLPGFVTVGANYQITPKWLIASGYRYVMVKNANFSGREQFVNKNYWEFDFATEYQLFDKFLISGGYTYNKSNMDPRYHNDTDYWIPGHTFAFGGKIDFSQQISLNFGALFTKFTPLEASYNTHIFADGNSLAQIPDNYDNTHTMSFNKTAYIFAVGVDFSFPNNKNNTQFTEPAAEGDDTPFNYRGM